MPGSIAPPPADLARKIKKLAGQKQAPSPAPVVVEALDRLYDIDGIGEAIVQKLTAVGITTFAHLIALTDEQITKLDTDLDLRGSIKHAGWVEQAKALEAAKIAAAPPASTAQLPRTVAPAADAQATSTPPATEPGAPTLESLRADYFAKSGRHPPDRWDVPQLVKKITALPPKVEVEPGK